MKHIGAIDIIKVRRGSMKAASTIASPNDVSRVVWAISEFFILLSSCFVITNGYLEVLKVQGGFLKATTTKTGPNDARRVVWAISEFILILSSPFLYY